VSHIVWAFSIEKLTHFYSWWAEKIREKQEVSWKKVLQKSKKITNTYFNKAGHIIEVCTYNTAIKNRLTEYAVKYPSECRMIDDDEQDGLTFEISKWRLCFKLTATYDGNRRKAASELAKKNIERLKKQKQ